jgi:hypothetical protein
MTFVPKLQLERGQTSADRTKPGPSFQLKKWPFACCTFMVLLKKLSKLKLKTRPKQNLGSLPLDFALPSQSLNIMRSVMEQKGNKPAAVSRQS